MNSLTVQHATGNRSMWRRFGRRRRRFRNLNFRCNRCASSCSASTRGDGRDGGAINVANHGRDTTTHWWNIAGLGLYFLRHDVRAGYVSDQFLAHVNILIDLDLLRLWRFLCFRRRRGWYRGDQGSQLEILNIQLRVIPENADNEECHAQHDINGGEREKE